MRQRSNQMWPLYIDNIKNFPHRNWRQYRKFTVQFFYFLLIAFYFGHSQTTEIKYLSGHGKDDMVKWDFYCTGGMNSGKWTQIGVPSCWELQGFGKYDYGFAKDSIRGKEKGLYKYEFTVPATWKAKQVNLVFEGVMTDAEVKVNGQLAGPIHQGAFYAFKYNISSLLKWGEKNVLEVTVAKHSANQSVNEAERKADFWIFGGIFRPVFLEALPQQHIIRSTIDAKANGSFTANVYVKGGGKVTGQIYTLAGVKMGAPFSAIVKDSVAKLKAQIASPKLWNAETPNRYKVIYTLVQGTKPVHIVEQKFGFRTVEVKQHDGIYVNGEKQKMKGVNRHSFWPESGRTTSYALSVEDVQLMKDMNMNAVRMSHYPPDGHFLDVCDSLGLYVMDELAGWHGHYDTETGTKRVKEMLDHDVNHPSIIFWSNGNEGGHNRELDHLFTEQDPQQRPVIHPWEDFGGFDTQHYRDYNYGIGNYNHGHSIVMPTEFLHGLYDGGHGAGLEDYWNAMLHDPLSAGGFLWDFADEGVARTDKNGFIDTDGNHGADGIVGPHHEKEGSYYAIKEIWSPVYIEPKEITPDWDGKLVVENRYAFTNLKEVEFDCRLSLIANDSDYNVYNVPNLIKKSPNVKPSDKGYLQIFLPFGWRKSGCMSINITAKRNGETICKWTFPLVRIEDGSTNLPNKTGTPPQITTKDSSYQISVSDVKLKLSINRYTGLLQSVESGKKKIALTNGPIIQQGATNFKGFTTRFDSSVLIIESTFDKKESYNTLQWTIYPSGTIKMKVRYFPGDYRTDFIGVNFNYPDSQNLSIKYLGYGPYRVWKNRMKGGQFGIWDKKFNNQETGEAPFRYPEFKGYYKNVFWCEFFQSQQTQFLVSTGTENLFLRLFTPAWKTDQWHNYEPIFPSGDISFMQGIPGIGTKTQNRETTGPMGMKNIFYDYEKDPSRALEIVLYFDFTGN